MGSSSISVRTFLKSIVALAATVAAGAGRAEENAPRVQLTLSQLIVRLRQDVALRARFAANPRLVFKEFGIDPSPYNLPERISEAQMNRLLDDLSRQAGPAAPEQGPSPAPLVVYGPPPGMRSQPPPAKP